MKKDIDYPEVQDIYMAIAKDSTLWKVYLINRGTETIDTILITSKGYGEKDGKPQKTSTLRHAIPKLEAGEHALIEPIDPGVFHLTNEYWLSYYIGQQVFDKKYLFVPETINPENFISIPEIGLEGVLHS